MIIAKSEQGWLVDQKLLLNSHFISVTDNCSSSAIVDIKEGTHYSVNPDMFNIYWPYMMDSQFLKYKSSLLVGTNDNKPPSNSTNEENCELQMIRNALEQLTSVSEYFCVPSDCSCPLNNNTNARNVAASLIAQCAFCNMCTDSTSYKPEGVSGTCEECTRGRLVTVDSPSASMLHSSGGTYLIPAHCSFLLSDVRVASALLDAKKTFDLIVVDPPWENKSVKRKRSYNWLSDSDLARIPIGRLANAGCLLVVWATNNERQLDLINTVLFPAWRATPIAQWYWLKVTRHGRPVLPLSDRHKKPYERLIIGRVIASDEEDRPDKPEDIPSARVIVSVPSSVHSSKPPLTEVLKPYLPNKPQCLEIFARNLLPHWTSWGNEVLKLQHTDLFIKQPLVTKAK